MSGWEITTDVHIRPVDDRILHEMSETCPCLPTVAVTDAGGSRTFQFQHRRLDGLRAA